MLIDLMQKALALSDSMLMGERMKAMVPSPLMGGGQAVEPFSTQLHSMQDAAEQYQHNREWVHACVTLIAQRVAGQTIHIGRVGAAPMPSDAPYMIKAMLPSFMKSVGTNVETIESHLLLDVIQDPYDLGTGWSLMFVTVASLELTGRAIWYIDQPVAGGKIQILPIPISWIQSVANDRSVWKIRIPASGRTIDLPGDQVAHFFYPDPADPWGACSPLGAMAASVLADESIMDAQCRIFRQGHYPTFSVTIGEQAAPGGGTYRPELTPEQREQLVSSIRRMYRGMHKMGEPFILDGMIESIAKLSLTPDEMGFLDSSKITKSRVLQGYHVNPILLGEIEGANRASATVADEIFVANKINPLLEMLSQSMTAWLGPMFSAAGERLVIWIEPAVARDAEMMSKNWTMALQRGAVTLNEFRRVILNLPPIAGGDDLPDPMPPSAGPIAKAFSLALDPYSLSPMNHA